MSLATAQVLRTRVPLKSSDGTRVPVKTRVVVMSTGRVSELLGKDTVKVKVADPAQPDLAGKWFVAAPGAFNLTRRGRPRKAE